MAADEKIPQPHSALQFIEPPPAHGLRAPHSRGDHSSGMMVSGLADSRFPAHVTEHGHARLTMIRRFFRKLLLTPMIILAALIMFFEEWLWDRLAAIMARLAQARVFRWMETRLAALPPYGAMVAFLLPGTLLLPVKLGALYLMAHGHPGGGILIIVLAKIIGTAIVARLFTICRPALLTLRWFQRLYEGILRLKHRLYSAVKSMPGWTIAVRWKNALKARFARGGIFSRRWKAVSQYVRQRFKSRAKPETTPSTSAPQPTPADPMPAPGTEQSPTSRE